MKNLKIMLMLSVASLSLAPMSYGMEMNKFQTTEQNKVDIFLQNIPDIPEEKQSRLNRDDEINKAIDGDFDHVNSYKTQKPSFSCYDGGYY